MEVVKDDKEIWRMIRRCEGGVKEVDVPAQMSERRLFIRTK